MAPRFQAGDVVKGRFQDDEWYLATVEEANADGTFTVTWFDSDPSCRVKRPEELRPVRFSQELGTFEEVEQEALPPQPPMELQRPAQEEQEVEDEVWEVEAGHEAAGSGEAPLVVAVRFGDEVAVGRLLAGRADPNVLDAMGEPPLFEAAAAGARPLVALLLLARAEPRLPTASGVTAASLAGGTDPVLQEMLLAPPGACLAAPAWAAQEGLSLEARHALLLAAERLDGKGGSKPSPQASFPASAGPTPWALHALAQEEAAAAEEEEEEGDSGQAGYSMAAWMRPAGRFFSRMPARMQRLQGGQPTPTSDPGAAGSRAPVGAKDSRGAAAKPSKVTFDAEAASAMLDELLEAYAREDFVKACAELNGTFEAPGSSVGKDPTARIAAIESLCLRLVFGHVIARYGFSPDEEGSKEVKGLVAELSAQSQAVRERNLRATQLIMGHFRKRPAPRKRGSASA